MDLQITHGLSHSAGNLGFNLYTSPKCTSWISPSFNSPVEKRSRPTLEGIVDLNTTYKLPSRKIPIHALFKEKQLVIGRHWRIWRLAWWDSYFQSFQKLCEGYSWRGQDPRWTGCSGEMVTGQKLWRYKWDSWASRAETYWRENAKLKTNVRNWNLVGYRWQGRSKRVAWFLGFWLGIPKLWNSGAAGCVVGGWSGGVGRQLCNFTLDHGLCCSCRKVVRCRYPVGRAQIWSIR